MVVQTRRPILVLASIAMIAGLSFTGPAAAFEDQPSTHGLPGWQAVSPAELATARAKGLDEFFEFEAEIEDNGMITVSGDGTNTIFSGAFTGSSGLSNVILNNGNGAIIQAGIAVEVNVHPGPAPD